MLPTGWQEITSGLRASQEFDFQGGQMAYAVTDSARGQAQWQVETEIDGTFYPFDAYALSNFVPVKRDLFPAGKYRFNCTATSGFDTVKLWWAYCPSNFTDALL